MKYLKLFKESVYEGSHYKEISHRNFYDRTWPDYEDEDENGDPTNFELISNFYKENFVDFTKQEISKIEEFFPQWFHKSNTEKTNKFGLPYTPFIKQYHAPDFGAGHDNNKGQLRLSTGMYSPKNNKFHCIINKLKDEWYLVNIVAHNNKTKGEANLYFECDQLEGLLKCLQDNVQKYLSI